MYTFEFVCGLLAKASLNINKIIIEEDEKMARETYTKHWGTGGYTWEEAVDRQSKIYDAQGVVAEIKNDPRGGYLLVIER